MSMKLGKYIDIRFCVHFIYIYIYDCVNYKLNVFGGLFIL